MNDVSHLFDAADTRDVVLGAHPLSQETIPDFPREHRRIFLLVFGDCVHYMWGRYLGLGATNNSGFNRTCFIISVLCVEIKQMLKSRTNKI